jgi:hypothetical protein
MGLVISLLLLSLLGTIYLAASKNHATQMAYSALQDNATVALKTIEAAIQQAGNLGCARLTTDFPRLAVISPSNRLEGTDNQLTVRGGGGDSGYLLQPMPTATVMFVSSDLPIMSGDTLLVSNCQAVDIFQVRTVEKISSTQQKIISAQPLTQLYPANAEVRHYAETTFFLAPTTRHDQAGNPISALYRSRHHHYRTELVAGIVELHFRYDVRRQGQVLTITAAQVQDWSEVIGVGVVLKLQTIEPPIIQKSRYGYAALRE